MRGPRGRSIPAKVGAVTAEKQRRSGGEARLCPMKKEKARTKIPAGEIQLQPRRAPLNGGGVHSDAPLLLSAPCCTCFNSNCPVSFLLAFCAFLIPARKTLLGLPVGSVIFPNHASDESQPVPFDLTATLHSSVFFHNWLVHVS